MGFEEGEAERKRSEAVRPKLKGKGRKYRHLHCTAADITTLSVISHFKRKIKSLTNRIDTWNKYNEEIIPKLITLLETDQNIL